MDCTCENAGQPSKLTPKINRRRKTESRSRKQNKTIKNICCNESQRNNCRGASDSFTLNRIKRKNAILTEKRSSDKNINNPTSSKTEENQSSDSEQVFTKEFLPDKLHRFLNHTPAKIRRRIRARDDKSSPKMPPGALKPLWTPPRSPHNLIEEDYVSNPWGLLVATIFLNKTNGKLAKSYIDDFLRNYPDPHSVIEKSPAELESYFDDLGLKKRAEHIWKMSKDFVSKSWRHARELHGIGKYGDDAFRLFCLGDLSVEPSDRYLKIYHSWVKNKDKWKDNDW